MHFILLTTKLYRAAGVRQDTIDDCESFELLEYLEDVFFYASVADFLSPMPGIIKFFVWGIWTICLLISYGIIRAAAFVVDVAELLLRLAAWLVLPRRK